MVPYRHIQGQLSRKYIIKQLRSYLKNLVKVVFVSDKVQAKDILDNMDVHNFAVHLFRQVRNCSLHSVMFVIFSRFT